LAEGDAVIRDPRALRALAHPARLALLEYLYEHGPATATAAAAAAGVSAAAGSYHMRELAKWGLVEDAGGGNGRERPWRGRGFSVETQGEGSAADAAAQGVLLGHLFERGRRWENDFAANHRSLPEAWSRAAHVANKRIRLTAERARELGQRIDALCDEYRRAPEEEGAEHVTVLVRVIPQRVRRP
jgi:DNA-binding transcriptional ArsR family regulator